MKHLSSILIALILAVPAFAEVRFNRDIRPILSDNCFGCHGPDEKHNKAGLRLDIREGALANNDGVRAIVPNNVKASALIQRILATDAENVMPPPETDKHLSNKQIDLIKQWVREGAFYEGHWSYQHPVKEDSPNIDHFIDRHLLEKGVFAQPAAEGHELLRRLHFDLSGLPPNSSEVTAFLAAHKDDADQAIADRVKTLLASPQFGERMAAYWLDLVRYADSIGYHSDNPMRVALYREWVIKAFNSNQRFDEFTRWQLAGDLFPEPSDAQKIASGYNRLLQTTQEGGAQEKEYRAIYAADRVRNVSNVWLGGTLGCAQCHDHKYDPFTARDFYSMAAFFADIRERGVGQREGSIQLPSPAQAKQQHALAKKIATLEKQAKSDDDAKKALGKAKRERDALNREVPTTLITVALEKPRTTRILNRGDWQDDDGEIVGPAVPSFLGKVETGDQRPSRLDLANWLVGPDNPTTARTFVNRLWKLFYGAGLSRNVDDLGSQGRWPTHPELLDWLAVEFIQSGWDVKHMVTLMVTAKAYARTSKTPQALRESDPANELLARQTRFRLDAEMVRDNALSLAGLLVDEVGGESVKPYQPAGYWQHLNFPQRSWKHDNGPKQYRRALYTHWQRSFLHPAMLAFDAPSREECTAERPRSNTPLQALVLLNDPTYVEASRAFAERILAEGGTDPASRIAWACHEVLSRPPSEEESQLLGNLFTSQRKRYDTDETAAAELLAVGQKESQPSSELAAYTAIARTLLNLHETITRP